MVSLQATKVKQAFKTLLSCYLHDAASFVQLFLSLPFLYISEFPIGTIGWITVFVPLPFCLLAWPDLPDACVPLFWIGKKKSRINGLGTAQSMNRYRFCITIGTLHWRMWYFELKVGGISEVKNGIIFCNGSPKSFDQKWGTWCAHSLQSIGNKFYLDDSLAPLRS